MEWWRWLWETEGFVRAGQCGAGWNLGLIQTSIWGNLLVAFAYFTIPAFLFGFVPWYRRDQRSLFFRSPLMAALFGSFISLCGLTHLLRAVTFYWPIYNAHAVVTALTGLVSFAVAGVMLPVFLARNYQDSQTQGERLAEMLEHLAGRLTEHEKEMEVHSLAMDARMKILNAMLAEAEGIERAARAERSAVHPPHAQGDGAGHHAPGGGAGGDPP